MAERGVRKELGKMIVLDTSWVKGSLFGDRLMSNYAW
jgi:hypothetical protein